MKNIIFTIFLEREDFEHKSDARPKLLAELSGPQGCQIKARGKEARQRARGEA